MGDTAARVSPRVRAAGHMVFAVAGLGLIAAAVISAATVDPPPRPAHSTTTPPTSSADSLPGSSIHRHDRNPFTAPHRIGDPGADGFPAIIP